MPRWVINEINSLVFKFFWSGKLDLVTHHVVVQPFSHGGFSVVDFLCKCRALHVQWVRWFSVSPSSWVSFLTYWCDTLLAVPPHMVFCYSFSFGVSSMPPFYRSLFMAWRACDGTSMSSSLSIGLGIDFCPVDSITTKLAYLHLVSDCARPLYCEKKFFPTFGLLYWPATWRQLFFFRLIARLLISNGS